MKRERRFFAVCCIAATGFALALSACESADSKARKAFEDYQAAASAGDLPNARLALLQVVAAKDDDPEYWKALGDLQLQMNAFSDAYYAYTRAHELDKSNIEVLGAMTQLALLSGNLDMAERHAKQLQLLAPQHPAARLAFGYIALKRSDLDEADRLADELLASFPFETSSKLLKARVLLARGEHDQAIELLKAQVTAKPDDLGSLKALAAMHEHDSDWRGLLVTSSRIYELNPRESDAGIRAVDAAFRAGDIDAAKRASSPFLKPDSAPAQLDAVLTIWAKRWKSPAALEEARRLASAAPPQQRLAYATFFNEIGSPEDAGALIGTSPQLPLTRANLSRNAVIADYLARMGRTAEATRLLDDILATEPDHVYALRARINLEISRGEAKAAISDAQRLVSVVPQSGRDRLLLMKAYVAAGDRRQVDRTLWDAFHEIPGNFELYETLRAHVAATQGEEAANSVDAEFAQQRDVELVREFI